MVFKRLFDILAATTGLVAAAPVFLTIALAIKLSDGGPVIFRQIRVGKNNTTFRILKFRTMIPDAEKKGLQITSSDDARITPIGKFLRKTKLDELPQFINVIKGEMSMVGPRPEVPKYVAIYSQRERSLILSTPPGITDPASIKFLDENKLLANSENAAKTYENLILPQKIEIYIDYVQSRTLFGDIKLIFETIYKIAR